MCCASWVARSSRRIIRGAVLRWSCVCLSARCRWRARFPRMDKPSLLILEDDPAFARALQRSFERRGYAAIICDRAETLVTTLETVSPAFAVVDLKLVGPSGL